MVYCEQCGAANDIMNRQCHRCGHAMASETGSGPLDGTHLASAGSFPGQPSHFAEPPLNANLDLPDWLKQAADSTPPSPQGYPTPINQAPAGFHVAQPVAPPQPYPAAAPAVPPAYAAPVQPTYAVSPLTPSHPVAGPGQAVTAPQPQAWAPPQPQSHPMASQPPVQSAPRAQALPPVPTGDLPSSLPDWLRSQAPQAAPAEPQIQIPKPVSVDTSSFISEGDLPEWIRQIAAADAEKQAEEDRLAAVQAAQVASTAPAEPGRRQPLPGETIGTAANNPWLARREAHSASMAWGAPTAVEQPTQYAPQAIDDSPPEVIQFAPPAAEPAKGKPKLAMPKLSVPKASLNLPAMPSIPKVNMPSGAPASGGSPLIRYGLIAAVVLLVLIVFIGVVL